MRKFLLFLAPLLILNSCATTLNKKYAKVNIYAPKNTKVTYKDSTLTVIDKKVTISQLRSRDSIRFKLSNDSITDTFKYSYRISGTNYLNIFTPYYLGALIDLTNHKRFSYKKNHYFLIDSTIGSFRAPLSEPVNFKSNDFFIYTTPLKAIDYFSQPMLTIGAEYFFTDNMSFSGEYGTVFTRKRAGGEPSLKIVENKGQAFRYELKYYNLVRMSTNPRVNEYIGLEARLIRYQFNDNVRYWRTDEDSDEFINETFAVQKYIDVFNLKYGLNYALGKRLYIDLYYGLGLRIKSLKNPNRDFNPETDQRADSDGSFFDFRPSNLEGINDGTEFNFTLGFKFGIKF